MSYRTLKRALGESNLERKCRLLFGGCLLVLITVSFWWYGSQTDKIVTDTNRRVTSMLVPTYLFDLHKDVFDPTLSAEMRQVNEKMAEQFLRSNQVRTNHLLPKNPQGARKPHDDFEWELMYRWSRYSEQLTSDAEIDALDALEDEERREQGLWANREITQTVEEMRKDDQGKAVPQERTAQFYQYYQPLFARQQCVNCHKYPAVLVPNPDLAIGDLMAVVRIELDMEETQAQIAWNRSLLFFSAIVTVALAMAALYAIVRYIIVKPLAHLRDVSNAVRRGEVEQRAVIQTGDEFEDLGAAFNRMLRQLLRQQDELRSVNTELDTKIDELAQANMRLFEMNQLKSDFLATVSHELRTPLNSILGFSDLLGSADKLNDKQRGFAKNIERSGRQLLDMINDILDLAKIESGRMEVRAGDFDIGTVVLMQCDLARPLSERKHIDLDCEIAPGLEPMRQDQGKIEQILTNLLSNAIKFTPDGGRIHVSARRDRRGDLRLVVADTGVGISESEQMLVFEKFRQGSSGDTGATAMTREYTGTGLGLSIVRELCRLLGGDITLQSELGKGSEFTVMLPWTVTPKTRIRSPIEEELRQLTKPRLDAGLEVAANLGQLPHD
jgi:signal transduction histidine kinase